MSSKLRPLYDKLYMGIDTWILAFQANKDGRARAKKLPKSPVLDREYRSVVLPYWKPFGIKPKKHWYRINCDKAEHISPEYIPDDIWFHKIIPHFNTLLFAQALQDKCQHGILVPGVKRPATVVKNIAGIYYDDDYNLLTEDEAIARCLAAERFLIKPSVGSGKGYNIRFRNGSDLDAEAVKELFRNYGGRNFIVQAKLKQHKDLASIYAKSLNTIRIVTFLYKNDVHILSMILRIGSGGSEIDNVSQGGMACKVNPDGTLAQYAVNRKGQWVDRHPDGAIFADVTIPGFQKLIETVKEAASKIAHFKILGWDFAIDESGEPVFIEYNVIPGQNQKTWGPTFGSMTKNVLEEVFKK